MESSGISNKDILWLQGTRRNTRSSSNQEKEAKEKSANSSDSKDQSFDATDSRKKESSGSGRVVRGPNNEALEYVTEDGVSYKVSDSAYIATERSDHPYSISTIQEIKVSKKDNAVVHVKWYYRPSEVPDSVYQMLVKERLDSVVDPEEKELILNMETRNRELFIVADDDLVEIFPVSSLRGKCTVKHLSSFQDVKGYDLKSDSFFYVLGYNPDTRRLTNVQGEVKVGPSHQWTATSRGAFYKAVIPECKPRLPPSTEKVNEEYEDLTWEPGVNDCDLIMYLRSARSMAAFASMCDGGSAEEGCVIASRDQTTINALNVLFQCNGDARAAVQVLVKKPLPITIERKWTEDQVKRFQKGLRQNGKNFYKIKKDHFPNKETADLVEFYYLWKKAQENLIVQPQNKQRRQAALKRNAKNVITPTEGDGSSSEIDSAETEESEKETTTEFTCQNCRTTTSEDWNIGGKESVMLCTKCRILFKKYGEDACLKIDFNNRTPSDLGDAERTPLSLMFGDSNSEVQPPPFMFKPIKEKLSCDTSHDNVSVEEESPDSLEIKNSNKRRWKNKKDSSADEREVKKQRKTPEDAEQNNSTQEITSDATKPLDNEMKNQNANSWQNGLKEVQENYQMKQETKEEKLSAFPEPMSVNPSLPPDYPAYAPFPIAFRGVAPFPPPVSLATSTQHEDVKPEILKKEKHESTSIANEPESTDAKPKLCSESSFVPTSSYPLGPQPQFYPPNAAALVYSQEMRTPNPMDPSFLPHSHLYTWPHPKARIEGAGPSPGEAVQTEHLPEDRPPAINNHKFIEAQQLSRKEDPSTVATPSSHQEGHGDSHPPAIGHVHSIAEKPSPSLSSSSVAESGEQHPVGRQTSRNDDVRRSENPEEPSQSPSDEGIITVDEPGLPIFPEHHITIPAGQQWPIRMNFYDDGLSGMDRSKDPVIGFEGKKVRLSTYPGFLCSRTDFVLISPKLTSHKKQQSNKQQTNVPQKSKTVAEREVETPKSKPREENSQQPESTHAKIRPYPGHFRAPVAPHVPPMTVVRSTPIHTPTSAIDANKHLVTRSSPYLVPGVSTPASETLRHYANMDSQREALTGVAVPLQPHYPFHLPQNDRDLREREMRERMSKHMLGNVNLPEPGEPHVPASIPLPVARVHPVSVAGAMLNQQMEQMRQTYPGGLMGVPGAGPIVSGVIPGFSPMLAAPIPENIHFSGAELERLAVEQRMQADRAALEQYQMDLLQQSHQHSHVHSHLHLHPQNPPPPGIAVIPPTLGPVTDPMMNPYVALQNALVAGVDPALQAAAAVNPMLNLTGVQPPPAIFPGPGVHVPAAMLPGRLAEPLALSAAHQLQAVAHENYMEQQRAAAVAAQQEYLLRMAYMPKH